MRIARIARLSHMPGFPKYSHIWCDSKPCSGMHCTKSHCLPWVYIFASGQACVAMSRVRTLDDLVRWNFDPSVIQLNPFYQQLLQLMDCVDVINPNPHLKW